MVTTFRTEHRCKGRPSILHPACAWLLTAAVTLCVAPTTPAHAAGASSTIESTANDLFKAGDYAAVTALFQTITPGTTVSNQLLRTCLLSYIRLGRTDEALAIYARLVPAGHRHDPALLRPLALTVITGHVRDRKEHVRIAAYSALAELGLPETAAILEDGLLDSSVLVRARAAEAIGKPAWPRNPAHSGEP